ncbi:MAG: hypothetical protein CMJ78_06010 [Planctomycetaceae bacterium]|nr:hypothetical protein [Planctomycetaceae bacterium]
MKLDPSWLDAAIDSDDWKVVHILVKPKHKGSKEYLTAKIDQMLSRSGDPGYEVAEVLETMNRTQHAQTIDYYPKALEKHGKKKSRYHYAWWLLHMMPDLSKSAVPRIEALLPSLNESVVDQVIPYLERLKEE